MKMSLSSVGLRTVASFSARKLLMNRRWMLVVLLGALVALVGLRGHGGRGEHGLRQRPDGRPAAGVPSSGALLIYGASMIRNEMDDRSIVQVITAP